MAWGCPAREHPRFLSSELFLLKMVSHGRSIVVGDSSRRRARCAFVPSAALLLLSLPLAMFSGVATLSCGLATVRYLGLASLRASRVPFGRHSSLRFLGCGFLLRPLGLRVWLPTAPPPHCFTLVAPVGVPSWPCVASVSASLERAAYCAPLGCGASCLITAPPPCRHMPLLAWPRCLM